MVQVDSQHRQDIVPGSTIGTKMLAIGRLDAVLLIVITGVTWSVLMFKRHIAQTRSGILYRFAAVVTSERTSSMLMKS